MRVLQIIDSLHAGGAERMAVNYANALSKKIEFSGLIATRSEGDLKNEIYNEVSYKFINKKSKFDFKALLSLRKFVKQNQIEIIHAHGTSYFFSVLLKCIYPKIKIAWHDHFGNRILAHEDNLKLKFFSRFFSIVFTVNTDLEKWGKQNLKCSVIKYLPNFASDSNLNKFTVLKGENKKRMVCLANLKKPKNHLFMVKAFHLSKIGSLGYSLHFIGNDYDDDYSKELKSYISENKLSENIFFYGIRNDINYILSQANIGILCSTSEGFPVSILEYGNAKLSVIATNVGEISSVIQTFKNGILVESNNLNQLVSTMELIAANKDAIQEKMGNQLYEIVKNKYSEKVVINQYLTSLHYICNIGNKKKL